MSQIRLGVKPFGPLLVIGPLAFLAVLGIPLLTGLIEDASAEQLRWKHWPIHFLLHYAELTVAVLPWSWFTTYKTWWIFNGLFCLCSMFLSVITLKAIFFCDISDQLKSTFRLFLITLISLMTYALAYESITWVIQQGITMGDRFINFPDRIRRTALDFSSEAWLGRWVGLIGYPMLLISGTRIFWALKLHGHEESRDVNIYDGYVARSWLRLDFLRTASLAGYVLCAVTISFYLFSPIKSPSKFLLQPETYDIWRKVRLYTPRDSLIFTDQTTRLNSTLVVDSGSAARNYYGPTIARRQFFIAVSFDFRNNLEALRDILTTNQDVLLEKTNPRQIKTQGNYSSYFGVVENSHTPLQNARLIYKNHEYTLYELTTEQTYRRSDR